MEELEANTKDEHLDADFEVCARKYYMVEDVEGGAAAAAPEQMQTEEKSVSVFASSKTEVFELTEESLRQCKGVQDLNDDEIMELCAYSRIR